MLYHAENVHHRPLDVAEAAAGRDVWLPMRVSCRKRNYLHQQVHVVLDAYLAASSETLRAIHPAGQLLESRWHLDDAMVCPEPFGREFDHRLSWT